MFPRTVTQRMLLGAHLKALLLPVGCATHVLRKCLLSTLLCAKCLFKGCVCVCVCVCVYQRGGESERAILVLLAYTGRF